MKENPEGKARENRIYEITADANDQEEVMMGWFAYLDDSIVFPFEAECIEEMEVSPLRKGEKVTAFELYPKKNPRRRFLRPHRMDGAQDGRPARATQTAESIQRNQASRRRLAILDSERVFVLANPGSKTSL